MIRVREPGFGWFLSFVSPQLQRARRGLSADNLAAEREADRVAAEREADRVAAEREGPDRVGDRLENRCERRPPSVSGRGDAFHGNSSSVRCSSEDDRLISASLSFVITTDRMLRSRKYKPDRSFFRSAFLS